jgi:hypothetical protein
LLTSAFIVGCFEKHPVRMFNASPPFQLPSYSLAMVEHAQSLGFTVQGYGVHTKFGDKVSGLLLRSGDGYVMALIGEGTIIGMTTRKTLLFSQFAEDRILLTVDEAGTGEIDERTTRQIIMNASFEELVQKHYTRAQSIPLPMPFLPNAGWHEIDDIYRKRSDRLAARGLARYVDDSREMYRYAPAAAFRLTLVHGVLQSFNPVNLWRHHKRRPSA